MTDTNCDIKRKKTNKRDIAFASDECGRRRDLIAEMDKMFRREEIKRFRQDENVGYGNHQRKQ